MIPPSDSHSPPSDGDFFRISTVSRLTGISTHTLRIWEKRHNVVTPQRSDSQRRLYSRDDVRRLALLKALVDRGQSIGNVASLDIPRLEQRLEEDTGAPRHGHKPRPRPGCEVAVSGEFLASLLRECPGNSSSTAPWLKIRATFDNLETLEENLEPGAADLILAEVPVLFASTLERLRALIGRTSALRAIVVYRFAHQETKALLQDPSPEVIALWGPVNCQELEIACLAALASAGRAPHVDSRRLAPPAPAPPSLPDPGSPAAIPPQLFTQEQLTRITLVSTSIDCECPHHLASLLFSLTAFESYSAECENRNEDDARVHALLHRETARARRTLEDALKSLLDHEGIAV